MRSERESKEPGGPEKRQKDQKVRKRFRRARIGIQEEITYGGPGDQEEIQKGQNIQEESI